MIGKPEWFKPKRFGWGLTPKTKEGWLYVLVLVLVFVAVAMVPGSESFKITLIVVLLIIVLYDTWHIMRQMK